jgi:putative phosphoribosyl transferase
MTTRFRDRREAGLVLAQALMSYRDRSDVIVLALPRGGVPVGYEVARALNAPLDIFLVRKVGLPGHEELAMAAVASGGLIVRNEDVLQVIRVDEATFDAAVQAEFVELERRERLYRGNRTFPDISEKTVILVDDGLATGSSVRAGLAALRQKQPRAIVVAVPVAPYSVCQALREDADEMICARTPEPFYAVGIWYENFTQTTDEEVRELLALVHDPGQESRSARASFGVGSDR